MKYLDLCPRLKSNGEAFFCEVSLSEYCSEFKNLRLLFFELIHQFAVKIHREFTRIEPEAFVLPIRVIKMNILGTNYDQGLYLKGEIKNFGKQSLINIKFSNKCELTTGYSIVKVAEVGRR